MYQQQFRAVFLKGKIRMGKKSSMEPVVRLTTKKHILASDELKIWLQAL